MFPVTGMCLLGFGHTLVPLHTSHVPPMSPHIPLSLVWNKLYNNHTHPSGRNPDKPVCYTLPIGDNNNINQS